MPGYIDNSSDLALFESYSQGRALGGEGLPNMSQFAQWSAVLDKRTCDWCGWADERVFNTVTEPYDPPTHHGCRCLIAYISNDEFPPNPDWGSGPPANSWPPGTYECSKGRLLTLAEAFGGCITGDLGKNPKPKTGKEVFIKADQEAGFSRIANRSEATEIQNAADGLAGVDKFSDISGAIKTTVDPTDLIASQDIISVNKVNELIKSGEFLKTSDVVGDGVLVLQKGGELFLVDGHHRAIAAFREVIDFEVWIIDIAKLA